MANGHANIAGTAIHVGSADNTRTVTDSHKTTIDTLSLTIGNAWVDGAMAANDAIKKAGQHAYNTGQGKPCSNLIWGHNQIGSNGPMVPAMALGNAVANMAGSVATAGFYGAVSATHREQSSTQTTTDTWARGSTIVSLNGTVAADASNDVRVTGSLVNANRGDITLSADEITINSATNNHNSTVVSAVKQSQKH